MNYVLKWMQSISYAAYDYFVYSSCSIRISKQSQGKLEDSWSPEKLVDGKINWLFYKAWIELLGQIIDITMAHRLWLTDGPYHMVHIYGPYLWSIYIDHIVWYGSYSIHIVYIDSTYIPGSLKSTETLWKMSKRAFSIRRTS